jgi:hypothetical protein
VNTAERVPTTTRASPRQAAALARARGRAPAAAGFQVEPVFVEYVPVARGGLQPLRQPPWLAGAQSRRGALAGFGQLPGPGMGFGQGFATTQGRRQCRRQHLAQRGMGIARQPAQRLQQLAVEQRLRFQLRKQGTQLGTGLGRRDAGDDADQFAAAERHPHPAADRIVRCRCATGREVVERLRQRQRQHDLIGGRRRDGNRHRGSLAGQVAGPATPVMGLATTCCDPGQITAASIGCRRVFAFIHTNCG